MSVVGREVEIAAVGRFLADAWTGPASLVLEGSAGIGKTAIWQQAVQDARTMGMDVRVAQCAESDSGWAFAGLGDLLDRLPSDSLAELPEVQRAALSAALLLTDVVVGTPGSRVVGVAVLGVLRRLAARGPVLLAVDDIQWMDPSSRKVLSFALRRLTAEPVRLISSYRSGPSAEPSVTSDLDLSGERIVVGPASVGVLQRIVQARLGQNLPRPTLTRLHQATGGNPMMCLEMVRMLLRGDRVELTAENRLAIPANFRVLVTERLSGLSDDARWFLLLTSALSQPTVSLLERAIGEPTGSASYLAEALAAGILELDGERIRFTHPLMASIPYEDMPPADRRRLHLQLAAIVTDPEEHARHAALGTTLPSSVVAEALDVAMRRARARGSIDTAAELAQLAVARTPAQDIDQLLRRTVDAARCVLLLGDTVRAERMLTMGLGAAPAGPARVLGLLLRATIASWESGDSTVANWCSEAIIEAEDDPLLLAHCYATLAETSPSGAALDFVHAKKAVELLDAMDEPPRDLLANALTNLACNGCRLGRGLEVTTLERAVAYQASAPPGPVSERAGTGLGMYLKIIDRFDESRLWLDKMRTCALDEGDDSALPIILGHLATLECWSGSYGPALALAEQGRAHALRMGVRAPMPNSAHVLALAHLGRLDEARVLGEGDLIADHSLGFSSASALDLRSLGFTEFSAGNPEAAATHFLRALSISSDEIGIAEPAILRMHGDAVAALVSVGRIDEARRLTSQLDDSVLSQHNPWATAIAGRCHGLLKAADGDLPGSADVLQQAVLDHRLLPMPFEEGCTRLLLGTVFRRHGHRNDAKQQLAEAMDIFTRLGAPIQAERARAELAGIGGWSARVNVLTPVEERIATLVAGGQTNREVAAALFLSVRTVESHLGRIYRKLGLRSRTELAAASLTSAVTKPETKIK